MLINIHNKFYTFNIEVEGSVEILLFTTLHIPEDLKVHSHRSKNLKTHIGKSSDYGIAGGSTS